MNPWVQVKATAFQPVGCGEPANRILELCSKLVYGVIEEGDVPC